MFWRGKSNKESGWLAVDVSATGVGLAHVARERGGKPQVTRCEHHPLPAGDANALARLGREGRLERYRCTTLLGAHEYQLLLVDAPNVPPAELRTAIRWRIKDMLDYRVDDATVDVLLIPSDGRAARTPSMYAVAARNEIIQGRVTLFDEAGIPLSVIDIPEMAQRNIAALLEPPGRALALASFDDQGGMLTFTSEGELYLGRRLDVTAGQLDDADESVRRQQLDRLALELQRSLDHFDRQYHFLALGKLVLAPMPGAPRAREHVASTLSVPVECLDLRDVLDCSEVPALSDPETQASSFLLVGAALRQEEKAL